MNAFAHPVRVSVEEYLASSYRPDCDYIDGEVQERKLGEKEHAAIQAALIFLFGLNRKVKAACIVACSFSPNLRSWTSPSM